ncbi:MAG: hypothetical protein GW941_00875 [Candidatus Pacebacteria bacterium]|nr:hypothetical protein [Candidatus Paceibacterota bacterium]
MYQKISETIKVTGVYKNHTFKPFKFLWHDRSLKIDQITLISDVKDGMIKKRFYSVIVGREVYRLLFNRETETWILDELWLD